MYFKQLLLFVTLFSFQFIYSQDFDVSILSIPDSLKQNANSVIRNSSTKIVLESSKKMTVTRSKTITVLNKLGNHNSEIVIHYDSSNDIKNVRAYVYNALGVEIKDIKKRDFIDRSAADGISLYNDGRLIYYDYVPTTYPYTISYEYEIESVNTAHIPKWFPYSYYQGIVKSSYQIIFPNDIEIQKLEKNFENYNIIRSEKPSSISYEINNSPAIKHEDLAPYYLNIMPWVMVSSNKYHLEGADGSATNWKDFGKWRYDYLYNGKDKINEATKIKVNNLVKNATSDIEKAKIIYDFVQKKTRYISVQEGIGGWKPMKADDVDRLSYGDCKGLTNYTKTLLDAVGVKSNYSVIWAGEEKRNVENEIFSMQGNHVILNIPTLNGDVWLECTSQIKPFGYKGTFTDDRNVLVITPEGGIIKNTGTYKIEESLKQTLSNYSINIDGNLEADIKIASSGIQYNNHFRIENDSKRDIEEHYKSDYWSYINNIELKNYLFSNNKDSIIFNENIKLSASKYASFSGERMLFTINAFNRALDVPKRYRNRKLPFEISRGYVDKDEFKITLPENYTIEALPNNVKIENKFGSYELSIQKVNEKELKYSRIFRLKEGNYNAKEYKAYRDFRKSIAKQDKSKVVLTKAAP